MRSISEGVKLCPMTELSHSCEPLIRNDKLSLTQDIFHIIFKLFYNPPTCWGPSLMQLICISIVILLLYYNRESHHNYPPLKTNSFSRVQAVVCQTYCYWWPLIFRFIRLFTPKIVTAHDHCCLWNDFYICYNHWRHLNLGERFYHNEVRSTGPQPLLSLGACATLCFRLVRMKKKTM